MIIASSPQHLLLQALEHHASIVELLDDPTFTLCVSSQRHVFLTSIAGWLWEGDLNEDEMFRLLRRITDSYCADPEEKDDRYIRSLAQWVMKKSPRRQ